ncbi:MAG: septal ring lytic transglycosylase RlpA family protein [Caulobacterales bacterium]
MVWDLAPMRATRTILSAMIAGALVGTMAPSAALAKGGLAEVVYYDPSSMPTRAKQTASISSGFQNQYAPETYPEPKPGRAEKPRKASMQMASLDQKDFVKIGAPYRQNGVWYVPAHEADYDEVGTASWYGADFNRKVTSNGEVFDMDQITAAHPTLPLPSIVEVTNLENGKKLKVRVNDRGPFMKGRLIDLSRGASKQLGFYGKGSAKVRVRYVGPADAADEPKALAAAPYSPYTAGIQTASYQPPVQYSPKPAVKTNELPVMKKPAPVAAKPKSVRQQAGLYLQVGAFSSAANADRLQAKLSPSAPAKVAPVEQGGTTLYRVVVGPLADDAAISLARVKAAEAGISSPRVVTLN